MKIQKAIQNVFAQLSDTLQQLSNDEYTQKCPALFNATIGQHARHIIELFICLEQGYEKGLINYEKRKRDYTIESGKAVAIELLQQIPSRFYTRDKNLLLEAVYDENSNDTIIISTNYFRELVYNLEHTVHHMALIRVGINEVSAIKVPEEFGVASSTIKYKRRAQAA
jgi:uncharacterized damage-inducible protein DinB